MRFRSGRTMPSGLRSLVIALTLLLLSCAMAQVSWPIAALIPDSILIRTPERSLAFDLSDQYPPTAFPATYPLEEGPISVQIQSNLDSEWLIELTIDDVVSADGQVLLTADQVEYRVSGSGTEWRQATGSPDVIYVGVGPTDGWLDLQIDVRLELRGPEPSGSYVTHLTLSAIATGL